MTAGAARATRGRQLQGYTPGPQRDAGAGPQPELGIVDLRETPHVEIATVTPEMAESMLAHNTHNRPLRQHRVQQLAEALKRSEWQLSPDAFGFDSTGVLFNGQHRLAAIAEAQEPGDAIILTGVAPRTQEITDIGLARKLSDVLTLRGETNGASLAAMLVSLYRLRLAIETGSANIPPSRYPTPQMLLALYEQEPALKASLSASRLASAKVTRRHGTTAALHYVLASLSDEQAAEDADAFFHRLATGVELAEDDPIFALRRAITNSVPRPDAARLNAYVIKAWNAWRRGEPMRLLGWKQGGALRERFPVPR